MGADALFAQPTLLSCTLSSSIPKRPIVTDENECCLNVGRTVQKALKRLFEYEGYKVEVGGDRQSALERFRVLLLQPGARSSECSAGRARRICPSAKTQRTTLQILKV